MILSFVVWVIFIIVLILDELNLDWVALVTLLTMIFGLVLDLAVKYNRLDQKVDDLIEWVKRPKS